MSSASSPTVPRPWRRHSGQAGGDAVSTPAQATEGQGPGQAAARGQKWSLPLVVTQICVSSRHMANLYLLQNFLGAAAKTIPPLPVPLPQPHGGHPALVLLSGMGAGLGGGAAALAGRQAPGSWESGGEGLEAQAQSQNGPAHTRSEPGAGVKGQVPNISIKNVTWC